MRGRDGAYYRSVHTRPSARARGLILKRLPSTGRSARPTRERSVVRTFQPNSAPAPRTKAMAASPLSPASPSQSPPRRSSLKLEPQIVPADDMLAPPADGSLVLRNVRVRIQKRPPLPEIAAADPEFETVVLPELMLPLEPTLDDIRDALTGCELGDPGRDIFFPAWTKSLYVAWGAPPAPADDAEEDKDEEKAADTTIDDEAVLEEEPQTIESDEALREALKREAGTPGSLTLLLQECRNARYSRRKRVPARAFSRAIFAPLGPLYAPPPRADRPIYFDRPVPFALHPAYACVPQNGHFPPEFYMTTPYMPMVPYVYGPLHASQR